MDNLSIMAIFSIATGALSLICLFILHFVSPEFKPSWRMVSEYALGKHKWILTSMFVCWALSNICLAIFLLNIVSGTWANIAALLIIISGIGAFMGGLFDVKHKLHGLAFALGIPTFPIGALIVAYHLSNHSSWLSHKNLILASAHGIWVSVVLMGVSMGILFSGLKKAGIPFGPNQEPLNEIPKTVIGINGYANRLLILIYLAFNITISIIYLNN